MNHWGHLLADLLSRLWCLELFPKNYKIAFCGVWDWEVHAEGQSKELLGTDMGGGYINDKKTKQNLKRYICQKNLWNGGHIIAKNIKEYIRE